MYHVTHTHSQYLPDTQYLPPGTHTHTTCGNDFIFFSVGTVKKAERALKSWGIKELVPSTWGMPFGANPRGIYGATPPEILHQYDLGIIKHAYLCMLGVIKAESLVSGDAYTARMRVLDDRLMQFNIRHADPAMPRVRFASGASNLSKMNASKYAPLLWQMIVVLGCSRDEAIVSFGWKNKIVDFGIFLVSPYYIMIRK